MTAGGYRTPLLYSLFLLTFPFPSGNPSMLHSHSLPLSSCRRSIFSSRSPLTAKIQWKYICFSHFERTGELKYSARIQGPTAWPFSFDIFSPFPPPSMLCGEELWGCIWSNFKVYINLTHKGENYHAPLILQKAVWTDVATFICHWTCCLMYISHHFGF